MVLVQEIIVGLPLYHFGWYNAICIALLGIAAYGLKTRRTAFGIALAGGAAIVVAGIAAGLLGADTHLVVGAPGTAVRDPQTGARIDFPEPAPQWSRRYTGASILQTVPRSIVYVRAADALGNQLTITQPSNATFLSPVLLMQQNARIAGMNVRVDGFALPALALSVKAVLLEAPQAARLRISARNAGKPAVLFALSSQGDKPVAGGIGIVASGEQRTLGNVRLWARVATYPAIEVASAPYLPAVAAGFAVFAAGAFLALRTPPRSKT